MGGAKTDHIGSVHNTRPEAAASVLSVLRDWAAPPRGRCISFRPPRYTVRNGTCAVTLSGERGSAGRSAFLLVMRCSRRRMLRSSGQRLVNP
jgi:hypothetical protein